MKPKAPLGRLEPVDLRAYWAREDTEFTPWLAREENIGLLGEALGMQLEVQGVEEAVGPFRADVLCLDRGSGALVLVENQLGRTDHSHLGQVLTYAAGLDAARVVWIAKRFADEHRAALDWLNFITGEEFHFFGVQVELWRVDDSRPAPRFHVLSMPNGWTKSMAADRSAARSADTRGLHQTFWRGFVDYAEKREPAYPVPAPAGGRNWVHVRLRPDLRPVVAAFSSQVPQVTVYWNPPQSESQEEAYRQLRARSDEVEALVGQEVEWHDEERWFQLVHRMAGVNEADQRRAWEWLHEALARLQEAARDLPASEASS